MDILKETFKDILDWFSDKIEGHESQFYATTYIVLFIIGLLLYFLSVGKKQWFEGVVFVVFFPIEVVCSIVFLVVYIVLLYKIIVALLNYLKKYI